MEILKLFSVTGGGITGHFAHYLYTAETSRPSPPTVVEIVTPSHAFNDFKCLLERADWERLASCEGRGSLCKQVIVYAHKDTRTMLVLCATYKTNVTGFVLGRWMSNMCCLVTSNKVSKNKIKQHRTFPLTSRCRSTTFTPQLAIVA